MFRDIMGPIYAQGLAGPSPAFPSSIEEGIDAYLRMPPDSGPDTGSRQGDKLAEVPPAAEAEPDLARLAP